MLSSFLRIMFYDPDKGWVEDEIKDVNKDVMSRSSYESDNNILRDEGESKS